MSSVVWTLAVEYAIGVLFVAVRLGRDWRGHRIHQPPNRKRRWSDTHWGAPFACTLACLLWPLSAAQILWQEMR